MKRLAVFTVFLGLAVTVPVWSAQEGKSEKSSSESEGGNLQIWKWANFVVLAGCLGYLAGKNAGPFFAARSKGIRKDMEEAAELRAEADARAAAVELRLANLESEIAVLRSDSQKEAQEEVQRLGQHTAAEIAKIQAHSEEEIAAAGKAARTDLKRYSAQLAIGLAAEKVRARMTPEAQDTLVRGFVQDLEHPKQPAR